MPTAEYIAIRQEQALGRIHAVIKKHADAEAVERIAQLEAYPGSRNSPSQDGVTKGDMFLALLAEDVAALAAMVDKLVEASKPKGKPGRKPNVRYKDRQ